MEEEIKLLEEFVKEYFNAIEVVITVNDSMVYEVLYDYIDDGRKCFSSFYYYDGELYSNCKVGKRRLKLDLLENYGKE